MSSVAQIISQIYPPFQHRDINTPLLDTPLLYSTMLCSKCNWTTDIEKQPNGREIFRGYEHRWRMPRVKPAELGVFEGPDGRLNMDAAPYPMPYEWGNAYYSFKYGSAHIIVISAYSNMDPGSTQYDWLVEELHSVDRTITPWLLITMHVPMYNTYDLHHHDLQIVAAREHIQPLLIEHRANMIFSGHIHAYQRTSNIVEDAVKDPRGPVHITIGAGGRACSAPFVNITAEPWIEQRDATMYGYGKFHIYNSTDAAWVWIPTIESDRHSFNYVKKRDDVHIPSVKDDGAWIKNQYFLN
uniref:Calcineurin-like phosphoesterase domain-containing protein n=1 Tax=Craspedostauros australis TaxID=1486917 RepID=A0A7R9WVC6_9STRA|mmetsp:Transcript_20213/g.56333  ORF Transcript_20213/g.56333 Transcript_20213/m.56333 type:complete len:298 (+) Transcript_20213:219-1112(+)